MPPPERYFSTAPRLSPQLNRDPRACRHWEVSIAEILKPHEIFFWFLDNLSFGSCKIKMIKKSIFPTVPGCLFPVSSKDDVISQMSNLIAFRAERGRNSHKRSSKYLLEKKGFFKELWLKRQKGKTQKSLWILWVPTRLGPTPCPLVLPSVADTRRRGQLAWLSCTKTAPH